MVVVPISSRWPMRRPAIPDRASRGLRRFRHPDAAIDFNCQVEFFVASYGLDRWQAVEEVRKWRAAEQAEQRTVFDEPSMQTMGFF